MSNRAAGGGQTPGSACPTAPGVAQQHPPHTPFVHTSPLGGTVQHGPRQRCSAVGSSSPQERSVRRSDSSSSQACQTSPPTAASRAVCNFDKPATGMEGFPRRNLFGMNRLERFQLSFRTFLLNPGNSFHMQPPPPHRRFCSPASRHGSSLSKYSGAISCSSDWNKFT